MSNDSFEDTRYCLVIFHMKEEVTFRDFFFNRKDAITAMQRYKFLDDSKSFSFTLKDLETGEVIRKLSHSPSI